MGGENIKDAWQLCCGSISPCSVIFITCIAEALKVPQINPALSRFGEWGKNHTINAYSGFTMQAFLFARYSHFPKSSLCPWVPSVRDVPLPLSPSIHPLIPCFLSFPSIHPSFPRPSATPAPPSPNMCYSNIAARTQCFSMPQDRQSITAWVSLSIGSEPLLAQP